ncbi:MAG TPA: ABC transporter ATP-binding protein [Bacteroidales bacterium]|nr:ABC transporter ATP-binding protein [Bacteroidales bacterium]
MTEKVAVEIKNVSKKYSLQGMRTAKFLNFINLHIKEQEAFFALKNVNLTIYKGEILGIIGPNGSGKSTLLKLISQITSPSGGEIEINGKVASILEIGIGFQPELSGHENIFLSGYMYGLSKRKIEQNIDNIVEMFGFPDFIHTPVKNYSSGMYMRLAFSIVCHIEADIYLFDEVLSVGDEKFQGIAINEIRKIKEKGASVCIVTHAHKSISDLCDKALLLNKGEVVSYGQTHEVLTSYARLIYKSDEHDDNLCFEISGANLASKNHIFLKTNDFVFVAEEIRVKNDPNIEEHLYNNRKLIIEIIFSLQSIIPIKLVLFIKERYDNILTSYLNDFYPMPIQEKCKITISYDANTFNPATYTLDLVVLVNEEYAQSYLNILKFNLIDEKNIISNNFNIGYINIHATSNIEKI